MANSIPASEPTPDAGRLLAGQSLDEAIAVLGQASNWAQAYNGSGTPRIIQCYPLQGSGAPGSCIATYATNAVNLVSEWRIPDTRGATSVDCYLLARSSAGAGEVEFRSVIEGGVTGVQVISSPGAGALELHGPFALDVDTTGGYETIRMYLDGNGGSISWAAVLVVVPPEASLPAGAQLTTGAVAFDADEFDADEPCAADQGARLIDNASGLRDVPHVYWQWSAIDFHSTDDPEAERMVAWPHVMPVMVWADTQREEWDLTVHVRCKPHGVDDQYVRLHAGTQSMPGYLRTCEIEVPSGGAQAWFTGTLRLPNPRRNRVVRNLPDGWETIFLVLWPKPTAAGSVAAWSRREGAGAELLSDAAINSVSVWGV